ncbi:MAG: ABC transporter ATP-binding protein [Bacteroidia bacterium]
MSNTIAIKVENLSKRYHFQNSVDDKRQELWALKDVAFEIKKGESVGIIGPNGSGKSTLLKILAGVTKPTSGKIEVNGRVASILEIGAGFHHELSGRENIFLNGQIFGFKKNEIEIMYDEIVAFSGIEKFIDEPVKNYSNGMYLRLAFSIMAHLDFDVYLMDEVLSVGDVEFKTKCFEKIADLIGKGDKSFLFISHNLNEISKVSKTAYFLKEGIISKPLSIDEALFFYSQPNKKNVEKYPEFVKTAQVDFYNSLGESKTDFLNTETMSILITNSFTEIPDNVKIGLRISDRLNNVVFNTSPVLGKERVNVISFERYNKFIAKIPAYFFNQGFFYVDLVYFNDTEILDEIKKINHFSISLSDAHKAQNQIGESGPIKPYLDWEIS